MVVTFLVVLDNLTSSVNVARNIPANLNIKYMQYIEKPKKLSLDWIIQVCFGWDMLLINPRLPLSISFHCSFLQNAFCLLAI